MSGPPGLPCCLKLKACSYIVGAETGTGTQLCHGCPSVINRALQFPRVRVPSRIICGIELCVHLLQPDADASVMALDLHNPQMLLGSHYRQLLQASRTPTDGSPAFFKCLLSGSVTHLGSFPASWVECCILCSDAKRIQGFGGFAAPRPCQGQLGGRCICMLMSTTQWISLNVLMFPGAHW